jgi:3-hydroxyisobutyrate dehydrogenase-like beta-hydroxyacid dehydrogenase
MPDETAECPKTIGILYPGEMGSAVGKVLLQRGFRVVTTLAGRSSRTVRLCREAGLEVLDSLKEVVQVSDITFSLVTPSAALPVAEQYCSCARLPPRGSLYVDLNSISPPAATQMARALAEVDVPFVDAAIHGLASQLLSRATLYLSGSCAQQVAGLFGPSLRVKILGNTPGQASVFKMLIAGLAKGLVALFVEMSVVAREAGLLDELLTRYRDYYPGVMDVVDRMVPTYPQHARRRGEEMKEVEQTIRSLGLRPCVVGGVQRLTSAIGRLTWEERSPHGDPHPWTLREVLEEIYSRNPLRLMPTGLPEVDTLCEAL